jgi:predicted  nucleic acid-binding Zn-ribbon protein
MSPVEKKLRALYTLQLIDSKIDEIHTMRGELPLEVRDLEDDLEGYGTRIEKLQNDVQDLEKQVNEKRNKIKESEELIRKYEGQQREVRNNREYESLNKEIEYQGLEIQLAEKNIKELQSKIENKNELLQEAQEKYEERKKDLDEKKKELDEIMKETEKDEERYNKLSEESRKGIEDRLMKAYERIRNNSRNGLAVVTVERDACGGCFNKIPPQMQLDIQMHKKIIVCEHCGRILVDPELAQEVHEEMKPELGEKVE